MTCLLSFLLAHAQRDRCRVAPSSSAAQTETAFLTSGSATAATIAAIDPTKSDVDQVTLTLTIYTLCIHSLLINDHISRCLEINL